MAKQASKTIIGIFVVGSIAMLIAGVIIFGGGAMFKETQKYVMFFESSVKGLSVGAPVVWHGVVVGSVSSVILKVDTDRQTINIPVVIEVDPSLVEIKGRRDRGPREQMKRWIEKGLRAQLSLQSIVTGQLMIAIEFLPNTPMRLTGFESKHPEMPTVTSKMDEVVQKLQNLPFEEIAGKLVRILDHLDNVIGDPEIKQIVSNLNVASRRLDQVLEDADKLVLDADTQVKVLTDNLNNNVDGLATSMQTTMKDAQKTLKVASKNIQGVSDDARKLLQNADNQLQPLTNKMQTALVSAKGALDKAKDTLVTVNGFIGRRSATRHKLNRTLDEIAEAAKSLNSLMAYLERHPEALLQGKGGRRR